MVSRGNYPKFTENVEVWTADDDWEPDEYIQWFQRLSDAKKTLKNTYLECDIKAVELVQELYGSLEEKGASKFYNEDCAKLVVRYSVAYNFYNRMSFEDVPDSKAVYRVQKYLPRFGKGMHWRDIARMLQAAADKVPFEKAMTDMLTEAVAYMKDGVKCLWEWTDKVDNYIGTSPRYFRLMRKYAKKDNLPTVAELPGIFAHDEKEAKEKGTKPLVKEHVEAAIKILNTDERIEKILTLSQDPGLKSCLAEVKEAVECMEMLLASNKFPGVLKQIADMEYEKLSWSKTIGPACVAIIRLGKRSAGKDFEKLAEYARKHARRPR